MVTNEPEQPWLEPHLWNRAVVLEGEIVEPARAIAATCEANGHEPAETSTYGAPHRAFMCRRCPATWTEPWKDER
jgi:hypothetical protein